MSAIVQLTEDSIKGPPADALVILMAKIHELVAAVNNLQGNGTPGAVTATTVNCTALTATGDVSLGDAAADKVGFYGHATIAQQTGVAVSAAGIHAALVALGLITA